MPKLPRWLSWAREIQALAQTGNMYAVNDFQRERYLRLMEISAEILASYSRLEGRDLQAVFLKQQGYATPKIDVRGAVFHQGKLLLVQEIVDEGWTMPGGWVDVGDTPSGAVEREVWEESGLKVRAERVIGIYDANRTGPLSLFHAFKIVFYCQILAGTLQSGSETSAVVFFRADEVPVHLSGERTLPRHLKDAFAFNENPNMETVFD